MRETIAWLSLVVLTAVVSGCSTLPDDPVPIMRSVPAWATPAPGTPYDRQSGLPQFVTDKKIGIELVLVPPGTFLMGASPDDTDDDGDERPSHKVLISQPFYLGKFEVTRSEWKRVAEHSLAARPKTSVSWKNIQSFLRETSFRLPTEAEWEYACRAGTKGPRYGELLEIARPRCGSVGRYEPNHFGLYDMLGNAREWCADYYGPYPPERETAVDPRGPERGIQRVIRGGSIVSNIHRAIRASYRCAAIPNRRFINVGFRVARDP